MEPARESYVEGHETRSRVVAKCGGRLSFVASSSSRNLKTKSTRIWLWKLSSGWTAANRLPMRTEMREKVSATLVLSKTSLETRGDEDGWTKSARTCVMRLG